MNRYYQLVQNGDTANINIYGDITSFPWLEGDVSAINLSKQLDNLNVSNINVYINSYGGEVAEGLAIYNSLKRHKAKVTTIVDGFACSIASVIFMAGDERKMNKASLLLIHNAWMDVMGSADELRKQADDLDKINNASVSAYLENVSISEKKLRELMDAESWIEPKEAVKMGFATEVVEDKSDKASQNAKSKIMQIILQAEEPGDEDENPKEEPDKETEPETEEPDKETDPEEEPEEEPDTEEKCKKEKEEAEIKAEQMLTAFFNSFMKGRKE